MPRSSSARTQPNSRRCSARRGRTSPAADFEVIRQRIDFLGVNYYKRGITRFDPSTLIERATRIDNPRGTVTTLRWEVFAPGLTEILVWVTERYVRMPLYVTENGAAFYDPPVAENGHVDDLLASTTCRSICTCPHPDR